MSRARPICPRCVRVSATNARLRALTDAAALAVDAAGDLERIVRSDDAHPVRTRGSRRA